MARQDGDQNSGQSSNESSNGRPGRNITGPQSALTDFLASHNISARQIRDEAEQRRQQAAAEARETGASIDDEPGPSTRSRVSSNTEAEGSKGKKRAGVAKDSEKVKSSKSLQKRKKDGEDADGSDELATAILEAQDASLPGQMENCVVCAKRFTVTPYTLAGPDGGLLCPPCGRKLAKERQGRPKKQPRKQTGGIGLRRTLQSRILDGDVGTKSLATLCVQTLAKNVDMADSLGDLPEHLVDKIARIFSKRRLLKPETLPLFAQPTTETLHIYDGSRLGERDFIGIFQVASKLQSFKARCAIQFKDEVMDYLLSRDIHLQNFYLHGANLLSEQKWHEFLAAKGSDLRGLQVYYTDKHFGDDSISKIAQHCPDLVRLKIENNQKVTDKGVEAIGTLSSLEHLGLQLQNRTSSHAIVAAVSQIGKSLLTLSLKMVPHADDSVLRAIHEHCHSLDKLRITHSEAMTDQGFVQLFTGWANPPLRVVDLQKCRHVDSTRPRLNEDCVGFCSAALKALMTHSGYKLEALNLHACRHIGRAAFEAVFNERARYPELRTLEISFCEEVNDFILGCIFRACPRIKEVNVFGCMKVKDVRVPRGVILVGVPNAQGMVTEGRD